MSTLCIWLHLYCTCLVVTHWKLWYMVILCFSTCVICRLENTSHFFPKTTNIPVPLQSSQQRPPHSFHTRFSDKNHGQNITALQQPCAVLKICTDTRCFGENCQFFLPCSLCEAMHGSADSTCSNTVLHSGRERARVRFQCHTCQNQQRLRKQQKAERSMKNGTVDD